MDLLVSTSHSVLAIDLHTAQTRTLHRGEGLYYGLARPDSSDDLLIGARGRLVSASAPMAGETGTILFTDRHGQLHESWQAPFALRDLHAIAWHQGWLWVTCCYDDLIALRAPDGRWRRWYPLGADETVDRYHFNSLLFEDDRVWVLAHQRGPSRLLAFAVEAAQAGRTVAPVETLALGEQAHNIWRMDGVLCTCSSAQSCLVSANGWRVETGGFPRGVARLSDGWAVGVSALAERQARDLTTGQVVFFDDDWRERGRVMLPGEGLVLDLLVDPCFNAPGSG